MMPNPTLDALLHGLALLDQAKERKRIRTLDSEDRSRRDWADQQSDVAMQVKLAQGGRPIERNQFGVDQVRDASLLSDPALFHVAGADIGSRRAPESGRTVNYTTRDGRQINVEAFNQNDLQQAALLMDAAKAAQSLRLHQARQRITADTQMEVEGARQRGRMERDEATRKAREVEVEPGVMVTPEQLRARLDWQKLNEAPKDQVMITLSDGRQIPVDPNTAAQIDQRAQDRKARGAAKGTGGGKPAATSKPTKQQRVLAAVKRIMEESRAAGGTAFEHYIDNADTQYLDDPEISELRKPIIEELEKRRQLAARDQKNRKWVRKAEYGDVYETLDPEARQQATPRGPATPSQSASNEDLSGLSTDELLRRLSNGN